MQTIVQKTSSSVNYLMIVTVHKLFYNDNCMIVILLRNSCSRPYCKPTVWSTTSLILNPSKDMMSLEGGGM